MQYLYSTLFEIVRISHTIQGLPVLITYQSITNTKRSLITRFISKTWKYYLDRKVNVLFYYRHHIFRNMPPLLYFTLALLKKLKTFQFLPHLSKIQIIIWHFVLYNVCSCLQRLSLLLRLWKAQLREKRWCFGLVTIPLKDC